MLIFYRFVLLVILAHTNSVLLGCCKHLQGHCYVVDKVRACESFLGCCFVVRVFWGLLANCLTALNL